MAVKFTNNAATTLAAGINSSATSISVTDGSVFPTITGSDHFYVTFDDTTNKEIVKVTARSGNTLTVVRGHDNTTARAFSSGDKAELRIVAALLDDVKTEVSSTLTVDTFTGNGSATAFTLSVAPASEDNLIVFIEGVYQNPGDFTLSGTTLTLDVAPANSRKIIVYHVAALVSGNNLTHNQFTCNGSTTAFTLSLSPIHENNTQVFLDGVYQQKTDYAVSGTTLTMDTAPANGAILEVMTFTQTEVNTLPASFVSGLTQVTAVGADHFMIFDATDSQLKKSLVSDVLESATSISTSADATAITIDSNEKVTFTSDVTTGGHLSVGGSNNELRFYEGSNYVGFEAPALSADKIWVLPAADGSSGQVISTDGSGNLSFADAASAFANLTDVTVATSNPAINTNPSTGVGTLWLNKNTGIMWCCTNATSNNNVWTNIGEGTGNVEASGSGGTESTAGGYKYHTFTSSGTFTVTGTLSIDILIVAGGGGGGGRYNAGGGGAGGMLEYTSQSASAGSYTITVGAGGAGGAENNEGTNGGNSSMSGLSLTTAVGGGGGGSWNHSNNGYAGGGSDGGSGGGSSGYQTTYSTRATGTSGQGNDGGVGGTYGSGGGGGKSAAGATATANSGNTGGAGGAGKAWLNGTTYAGGGGGSSFDGGGAGGAGGSGGGGTGGSYSNGSEATNGTANTGGGGGGATGYVSNTAGANGGSGIVIVRYAE